MAKVSNKVTEEAAASIINEYEQWLTDVIEQEKKTKQETARYFSQLRQKVEQITASLEEKAPLQ